MIDHSMSTGAEPGHVVMLLNNPCINDSRVIKSAEALVQGGWSVTVVCRQDNNVPEMEERNGVIYKRVQPIPKDFRSLILRLRQLMHSGISSQSGAEASSRHLEKKTSPISHVPTESHFRGTAQAGKGNLLLSVFNYISAVTRKIKRAVTYPVRLLYWLLETEEFRHSVFDEVLRTRPDVVHCHDLATLPAGVAIKRACGAKLIYDSHELEMHRNANYPWLVDRKRRRLEREAIAVTDAVITVSDSIADFLSSMYGIPSPVVILNASDFTEPSTVQRNVRDDLKLAIDVPLVIYVGGITINRGIDFVIRALTLLPEVHFAAVGPGRADSLAELKALASKLDLSSRVHFLPPVPPREVVGYIGTADVSVLPIQNVCLSYNFCMPNKLLESVFAGLPVAVADLVELRKFVDEQKCGAVMDEQDPKAIADAIRKILESPEEYVLDQKERELLNATYSWSAQVNKLIRLYSSFVSYRNQPEQFS